MKCAACGYNNRSSATVCKGCGEPITAPVQETHRLTCAFHDGSRYCPAPAEWHEQGNPWYCRWHNPSYKHKTNVQILDDLMRNGIPRRPNWRDFYVDKMIGGMKLEDAKKLYRETYEDSQKKLWDSETR